MNKNGWRSTLCALALSFSALTLAAGTEGASRKDVLKLASRVADWQLERMGATHGVTKYAEETANPRSWQQGAFWVGMTHLADVTGEKRFTTAILAMGEANEWTPGSRTYHADDHVIAQSYLWAARHGAETKALVPVRATFDSILANPAVAHLSFVPATNYESTVCLRRWCWCDALFMSPPAWVELTQQTGDPRYTEFAMAEFWATVDFLYDPAEKLFFRDSRFFERRDDKGRKQFWSRGNGWVFAGIANILDVLPKENPNRPRLERLFRDMAVRLKELQKADGYWPPSLLAPENSPAETSGTGFYVYGLAWGVNRGLLDAAQYRASIDLGWAALTRAVAKDGRLGWVQQVSDRPESVAETDTQYYGVGAFLLAASEVALLDGKRQPELVVEQETTQIEGWFAGDMIFPTRDFKEYVPYGKKENEKCVSLVNGMDVDRSWFRKFDSKRVVVSGKAVKYTSLADGVSTSDILLSKKYFNDQMVENFCVRDYVFVVSGIKKGA